MQTLVITPHSSGVLHVEHHTNIPGETYCVKHKKKSQKYGIGACKKRGACMERRKTKEYEGKHNQNELDSCMDIIKNTFNLKQFKRQSVFICWG